MLRYETMRKLLECPDRGSITHEVNKLSEEEAKVALIMALLSWRSGNKSTDEIDNDLRKRIAELEKQLAEQTNA